MRTALLALFVLIINSCTLTPVFAQYKDPDTDKQLREITAAPFYDSLSTKLSLLLWNVEKGLGKEAWAADFRRFSDKADLVLVQEGMFDTFSTPVLKSLSQFGWWLAVSWIQLSDNAESGVLTGATVNPLQQKFFRAKSREPVSQTGKMALASYLPLKNGETLLVVNIHGINFVPNYEWGDQMRQLEELLKEYDGPSIVAGDFNTWNGVRMVYLDKIMKGQKYARVTYKQDPRNLHLDHVYLRGCKASAQLIHGDINTSDHYPITMNLNCE